MAERNQHQERLETREFLIRPLSQRIIAQFVTYEGEIRECRYHEILDGVYGERLGFGERVGNKKFKSIDAQVRRYLKIMCDMNILKKERQGGKTSYILSNGYRWRSLSAKFIISLQSLLGDIHNSMEDYGY